MDLYIFNSATHSKEKFIPINKNKIGIYVCGPTIYDHLHIGNGRALIVYDVLYRIIKEIYKTSEIVYVRNITDIEDKIIARARDLGISVLELTKKTKADFDEVLSYTSCITPTYSPKATDHIPEMVEMIEKLLKNGNAYKAKNGDIYFNVSSYKDYNSLSSRTDKSTRQGARISADEQKKHHADFILWKNIKDGERGSVFASPFGTGRPGWHIECSAMSTKYLGADFDIHGGGVDLLFPHHTNEIAQTCCANPGSNYAKYWIHNGFVKNSGEKMSKSLGNVITIKELKQRNIRSCDLRLAILTSHYRKPMDFSDKLLDDSKKIIDLCFGAIKDIEFDNNSAAALSDKFKEPILSDINTPLYIKNMIELAKKIKKESNAKIKSQMASELHKAMDFLSFLPEESPNNVHADYVPGIDRINDLIRKRQKAKQEQNWKMADDIRNQLLKENIILQDKKDGEVVWKLKK